jgi:hypothetical protein
MISVLNKIYSRKLNKQILKVFHFYFVCLFHGFGQGQSSRKKHNNNSRQRFDSINPILGAFNNHAATTVCVFKDQIIIGLNDLIQSELVSVREDILNRELRSQVYSI